MGKNIIFFTLILILYFKFLYFEGFLSNKSKGPNIIQTWKNNIIPKKCENFINKIKKLNPNSKYLFFTDIAIDSFIKNKFPQYYLTYKNFPYNIQKIDFFRYLAVYYYGGVYLDLDINLSKSVFEFSKSKQAIFPLEIKTNSDEILMKQGFKGLIGNYAFYAPKGSLFLKKIIDNIVNDRIKGIEQMKQFNPQKYVLTTTGPVMVTQSYIDYKIKSEINIIEPVPFKSSNFGIYGKHHLMGSWKKKKVGIVISCFNRPDYVLKTFRSLKESNLSNTIICIIDDCSSDNNIWKLIQNFNLDNSKVIKIRNNINLGIWYSLKKGWDLLYDKCDYLTNIDSDVIVKKDWLFKLKNLENEAKKKLNTSQVIVSGFNCTSSCNHKIKGTYSTFYRKNTIGGINMFFDKYTYKNVVCKILSSGKMNNWDWLVCKEAKKKNCPIIVTRPSVIQHIGVKGLNSSTKNKIRYDIAEDF